MEKKKQIKKQNRTSGLKLPPIGSESENISCVHTILDIDPDFYSLIDGRPIKSDRSLQRYKENIRNIGLKRTLYGFLRDEILRIDREIETERKKYEKASKHFDEYQHSFDKFLAHDNNKTISIMRKSDILSKELINKIEENKKANYELATLKAKLQYIDETLQILISFQRFLYNAAPVLWRESEILNKPMEYSEILPMDTNVLCKLDVNMIKERLNTLPKPILFFQTPCQLANAFSKLEKQNLDYLLVTEEVNIEKQKFLKTVRRLKSVLNQELDFIKEKINETVTTINWNEMKENETKDFFYKILKDKFRSLVASELSLQIFNYVEFAFEQIIAPNDTNLTPLEMTLCLEKEYDNLMLDLSVFDLEQVKIIEKEIYEKGVSDLKEAKIANKLLKDVDKLNRRLKSAYTPSKRISFQ